MFNFLLGWRKASKCKSLIKKVQCRLKVVKKKRYWIVKQLRQDVAELLKNGHIQAAFERVEELLKDESMVEVYDLVDSFCAFILMNFRYIRKHKDCPNDINEAVSSLIYASARLGDLPELLSIRKLFGERYGLSFVTTSLELRHGNLVNNQIKENLVCIKKVVDDVKYKLLDEIRSKCLEPGPLFLEYKKTESVENLEIKSSSTQISSNEIQACYDNQRLSNMSELGQIVSSERFSDDKKILPSAIELSVLDENNIETESLSSSSSLETSTVLHEEMVYLDDIEELVPPVTRNGHVQDQRLFVFKSFEMPLKETADYVNDAISSSGQNLLQNEKNSVSRSSRMAGIQSRKRARRLSVSHINKTVTDVECELNYGVSCDASMPQKHESNTGQREERNKNLMHSLEEGGSNEQCCCVTVKSSIDLVKCGYENMGFIWRCNSIANMSKRCVIEHPYHLYIRDANESFEHLSDISKTSDYSIQPIKGANIENVPGLCKNSLRCKARGEARNEAQLPSCLRAMTMPNQRPDEIATDNMFRSNSFPLETPRIGLYSCPHIHPKLPDYDELAAKFMALKRENLQKRKSN